MADVTGPISTLPGAVHGVPEGTMCDDHTDRPAYKRVQGETDSFGSEMHDLCKECYDRHIEALKNADRSGCCDWCKKHADRLYSQRDYDEGSCGPVYQVCNPCVQHQFDYLHQDPDDE